MLRLIICISILIFGLSTSAQVDSSAIHSEFLIRVQKALDGFKPDTSAVPDDRITRKIIEIRNAAGKFNINDMIQFKFAEALQKGEMSKAEFDRLSAYMLVGEGKRLLDNAVIWIYRSHFTYHDLKKLARFFKSDTGKKWNREFPIILLQSVKVAEAIGVKM